MGSINKTLASPILNRSQRVMLWLAAAVNMLMIATQLPALVLAGVVALLLGNAWQIARGLGVASRGILLTLLGLAAGSIAISVPVPLSVEAGAMLAPIMVTLKLLETRSRRDAYVAVLLIYFLSLATFLFAQTMITATLVLIGVMFATAVLIAINSHALTPRRQVVFAATLIAQSVPFMVVLFVLFPRNLMPMWTLPASASRASSGLKDYMSPGSISDLSLSGDVAFRAHFLGTPPPMQQLYWRGPVMTDFDGRSWRSRATEADALPLHAGARAVVDYEITLEPHNAIWLLGLETPVSLPSVGYFTRDHQIVARNPVRARTRYFGQSVLFTEIGRQAEAPDLAPFRQLPAGGNPRARELAQKLRESFPEDAALVKEAYAYFSKRGFTYTLNPPRLGANSVDEFLFDTRRGFCEHFASAFVFLMRAAGIPARVVTGYQGGELNPIDGYLMVRQADAHAWAEVWIAGEGWQRVDPTASAAPIRVIAGLATAVPESDGLPFELRRDIPWLRELRFRMDAVNNGWNQWVLGYNTQSQKQLLSQFGLSSPDWRTLATASSALVAVFMAALAVWAARPRRIRDPAARAWHTANRRLARRGLARRAWEGPLDYAARIGSERKDLADAILGIATLYARLRFGPTLDRATQRSLHRNLQQLVRRFNP